MTRFDLIRNLPPGTIGAEIGVQRGEFSQQILTTPVTILHLVDAWAPLPTDDPRDPAVLDAGGHECNFQEVCRLMANDWRVRIIRQPSLVAVHALSLHILDWAYIDAGHTAESCLSDLAAWSTRIRDGGCLMVHDFRDDSQTQAMGFDVVRAVKLFCLADRWKVSQVTDEEWPTAMLIRR